MYNWGIINLVFLINSLVLIYYTTYITRLLNIDK